VPSFILVRISVKHQTDSRLLRGHFFPDNPGLSRHPVHCQGHRRTCRIGCRAQHLGAKISLSDKNRGIAAPVGQKALKGAGRAQAGRTGCTLPRRRRSHHAWLEVAGARCGQEMRRRAHDAHAVCQRQHDSFFCRPMLHGQQTSLPSVPGAQRSNTRFSPRGQRHILPVQFAGSALAQRGSGQALAETQARYRKGADTVGVHRV